jgi:hypothetical protein
LNRYSWGSGTLNYQGKTYPVDVKGLSIIGVGVTKATAFGKIYNLNKLEDFNGNYVAATAEVTLGGGAGATTMKNRNGVVIDLFTTTQDLNLKLTFSGISEDQAVIEARGGPPPPCIISRLWRSHSKKQSKTNTGTSVSEKRRFLAD